MNKFLLTLLLLCSTTALFAQQTANQLVDKVLAKNSLVKDYSASLRIRTDIPGIKLLPVRARIYYKQPDRFKVVSKSIFALPKQDMNKLTAFMKDKNGYVAQVIGTEMDNGKQLQLLSVIPTKDDADFLFGKVWIDGAAGLISKTTITTRSNGTVNSQYYYGSAVQYGLPEKVIFEIDVQRFSLPKAVAGDINTRSKSSDADKNKKSRKGKITIQFDNYEINKGIQNAVFE